MLYPLDHFGFVINQGSQKKIKKKFYPIIRKIIELFTEFLHKKIISIYIRGSVSTGKDIPFRSDLDCVIVTKFKLPKQKLFWILSASQQLGDGFPFLESVELAVVSLHELRNNLNLCINLKTCSVCVFGKDILRFLPDVEPGPVLSKKFYHVFLKEAATLQALFSGKLKSREYLFKKKSMKFWCKWAMRVLLRAGIYMVMPYKPIYSQELSTCYKVFIKEFPQYRSDMTRTFRLERSPINNRKELYSFFESFSNKLIKTWKQVLKESNTYA